MALIDAKISLLYVPRARASAVYIHCQVQILIVVNSPGNKLFIVKISGLIFFFCFAIMWVPKFERNGSNICGCLSSCFLYGFEWFIQLCTCSQGITF